MIDQVEMMRAIEKLRGDAIVVPVFRANGAWGNLVKHSSPDRLP